MRHSAALALLNSIAIAAQCIHGDPCLEVRALESSDCTAYHIFAARGSDSKYPGHLGHLMKLICDNLRSSCSYENIIYPANSSQAGPDMWCESAAIGVENGQRQIANYAERCPFPGSKLILLGYSQGASVSLDILGGGGTNVPWPVNPCEQQGSPPLDRSTAPGANIVAAAVFGAVVRSGGRPYSVKGGAKYNGTSPRTNEHLQGLDQYAMDGILRDYCNNGDFVCARGSAPEDLNQHLNYFDLYTEEAAEWVVNTAQNTTGQSLSVTLVSTRASATHEPTRESSSTRASITASRSLQVNSASSIALTSVPNSLNRVELLLWSFAGLLISWA